jgi:hypothetical protein
MVTDLKNKGVQALVKADVDNHKKNKDMKKEMPKKAMAKGDMKKAPSKKQEAFLKMIASKSKKK